MDLMEGIYVLINPGVVVLMLHCSFGHQSASVTWIIRPTTGRPNQPCSRKYLETYFQRIWLNYI